MPKATESATERQKMTEKPERIEGWSKDEWDEAWEAAEHDPELMPNSPPSGDRAG